MSDSRHKLALTRTALHNEAPRAYLLTVIGLLALDFGSVTLTGSIAQAGNQQGVKISYAVFALLGLVVIVRGRLVRPRWEMMLFFAVTIFSSLIAYYVFAPQRAFVNSLIALYVAIVGGSIGAMAGRARVIHALRLTSLVLLGAVLVKDALHIPAFLLFLANPNGHPLIPTFMVGGPNLESTWISMAGFFFIGSSLLAPYALASLAIGVAYASRIGVIIAGLVILASIVRARMVRGRALGSHQRGRLIAVATASAVIATGVLAARQFPNALGYAATRFQRIGEEAGSVGRLTLWKGGLRVFMAYPLGVGEGNAVPELERVMGVDVPEDNLHNQYLQYLVETGFPGLAAYLIFAVMTWRRLAATRFRDRILLYVGCYFLVALLQFSGGEFIVWYIYGLHTGIGSSERGLHAS